jgi:hypothetical protein
MFDVHFFIFFSAKNNLALMGFIPARKGFNPPEAGPQEDSLFHDFNIL